MSRLSSRPDAPSGASSEVLAGALAESLESDAGSASPSLRLSVNKTYKMFVGGAFVRSESGRSYAVRSQTGEVAAHAPEGSRKDVRDAVRTSRAAQSRWAARTAYNRGQILYRVAEVTESRRVELIAELERSAARCPDPAAEVDAAVDRWVWYAGWCDKYQQVLGGANPVAGDYFNFTIPEPMGVVGLVSPESSPLLGLISRLAPALVSGNAVVALASQRSPLPAVALAEILATSDVPAGVVNILTGRQEVLLRALAGHGEVDCLDLTGCAEQQEIDLAAEAERLASESVTRVVSASPSQRRWLSPEAQSPYLIGEFCEYKTVWHPKGQ